MGKYKNVFKLFLAGQEAKEVKWLSEMSKKGYHLVNVRYVTYYTFKKGNPKNYTYMIDMKGNSNIDDGEYLLIYKDYGLEYINKTQDYYYFRTDNESQIKDVIKNEQGRYLDRINSHKNVLLFGGIANILIAIMNFWNFNENSYRSSIWIPCISLAVGLLCIALYTSMLKKIKNMKKNGVVAPYNTGLKDWKGFFEVEILLIIAVAICLFASSIHFYF